MLIRVVGGNRHHRFSISPTLSAALVGGTCEPACTIRRRAKIRRVLLSMAASDPNWSYFTLAEAAILEQVLGQQQEVANPEFHYSVLLECPIEPRVVSQFLRGPLSRHIENRGKQWRAAGFFTPTRIGQKNGGGSSKLRTVGSSRIQARATQVLLPFARQPSGCVTMQARRRSTEDVERIADR